MGTVPFLSYGPIGKFAQTETNKVFNTGCTIFIVLQYSDFGDQHGIPGKCVSNVTNQPVSCETSNARYVPEFVIPFNQSTGVVSDGSSNY